MRPLSVVLCFLALAGCARSEREEGASEALSDAAVADAALVEDAGAVSTAEAEPAAAGQPCAQNGARACAATDARSPLLCDGSRWQSEPRCAEEEYCESEAGARQGVCVPIPAECIGRRSGEPFCVDSGIQVCTGFVPSSLRECGPLRRCVAVDHEASCVCALGAVDQGDGKCVAVVPDCDRAAHGCDPLTTCSLNGGQRTCGACPAGYTGDGVSGCRPQLLSLTLAAGSLEPTFAPEVSSYRVEVPAAREQLMIIATASTGAVIEIEGKELASDGAWTSPMLSTGEQEFTVTVIAETGITTRYTIVADRSDEM